jgi:hypothetical protein
MSDKSHVSMEQHVCFVCGKTFDTGNLLLDKRLRASMKRNTVTGYGICPEHQAKMDEGYTILIETEDPKGEKRTGHIAYVRESQFKNIFNSDPPPKHIAFVEVGVIEKLKGLQSHD